MAVKCVQAVVCHAVLRKGVALVRSSYFFTCSFVLSTSVVFKNPLTGPRYAAASWVRTMRSAVVVISLAAKKGINWS